MVVAAAVVLPLLGLTEQLLGAETAARGSVRLLLVLLSLVPVAVEVVLIQHLALGGQELMAEVTVVTQWSALRAQRILAVAAVAGATVAPRTKLEVQVVPAWSSSRSQPQRQQRSLAV
tara:strand:- start:101 stop:454 length:354 start_codon:yes stop_codon:yes gene_type:complete